MKTYNIKGKKLTVDYLNIDKTLYALLEALDEREALSDKEEDETNRYSEDGWSSTKDSSGSGYGVCGNCGGVVGPSVPGKRMCRYNAFGCKD